LFANADALNTSVSFTAAGAYVFRLTATDSQFVKQDDVTINVSVTPANQPPAINLATFQIITLPTNTVTLNATVTDDGFPTGSNVTVTWGILSAAGPVIFGNANSASTSAGFSVAGAHVFQAIERQMIAVFSRDRGRQQARSGNALLNRLRRLFSHGDLLLAMPAGILEADVLDDQQRSRHELQLFAGLLTELRPLLAAARAGQLLGRQWILDSFPRQVGGKLIPPSAAADVGLHRRLGSSRLVRLTTRWRAGRLQLKER